MKKHGRSTYLAIGLFVFGFFLAQLPCLGATYRFHGDEKFYTDAAIRMYRQGDILVPHYADGSLRLRKPVLTYWTILGGFELGGVSYVAARMGILLAATGVLAGTAVLARRLFGRPEAGLLAAAFLVADHELFTASWRLNPDALLTLWILLSLIGFAIHALSPRGDSRALFLGYVSAGLAIATKGFMGVAAAGYGLLLARFGANHLPGTRTRSSVHVLGILAMLAFGGAWYVAILTRFGPASLLDFMKDQAGLQPGGPGAGIAGNPPRYLLATFGDFLPGLLLLILGARLAPRRLKSFFSVNRRAMIFTLGWFGLLFIAFAGGRVFRPRYLLPAHPLLACFLAGAIVELIQDPRMQRALRRLRSWEFAGAVGFGIVVALVGVRLDPRFPIAGGTIVVVALLTRMWARTPVAIVAGLCVFVFGVLWSYDAFLRPVFAETPASQLAKRLESFPQDRTVLCLHVPLRIEAQLAVLTGGRHIPQETREIDSPSEHPPAYLLPENRFGDLPADRYRNDAVVHTYRHIDARLFLDAWRGRSRDELLAERRRTFVLALPRE